jgi:hypothetical protein
LVIECFLGGEAQVEDQTPEILGYFTDEHGKKQLLRRGPIRHESLTSEQLQRTARLRDVLIEACPRTLDGWVDGFMRDAHPASEIQIMEACAVVYQQLTKQAVLSVEEKQRLLAVVCAVSGGVDGPQLAAAVPAGKGLPSADRIVKLYQEARQSGSRP